VQTLSPTAGQPRPQGLKPCDQHVSDAPRYSSRSYHHIYIVSLCEIPSVRRDISATSYEFHQSCRLVADIIYRLPNFTCRISNLIQLATLRFRKKRLRRMSTVRRRHYRRTATRLHDGQAIIWRCMINRNEMKGRFCLIRRLCRRS
jgi:hypothetical protein